MKATPHLIHSKQTLNWKETGKCFQSMSDRNLQLKPLKKQKTTKLITNQGRELIKSLESQSI